jgi:hypothetical protein
MDGQDINKKFQKELLAGISSLVLLNILARSKDPMYGYQITKLLEPESDDKPIIKQGALYPVLRSLEKWSVDEHGRAFGLWPTTSILHDHRSGSKNAADVESDLAAAQFIYRNDPGRRMR